MLENQLHTDITFNFISPEQGMSWSICIYLRDRSESLMILRKNKSDELNQF